MRNRQLFLISVVLFSVFLFYVWQKIYLLQLGYNQNKLQKEIQKWEEENSKLIVDIGKRTSLSQIDRFARERLGMVSPDKKNIVILDSPGKEDRESASFFRQAQANPGFLKSPGY